MQFMDSWQMETSKVRSRVSDKTFDGLLKIVPTRHSDHRGYFSEVFKAAWFKENVSDLNFVQDNESLSVCQGTLRGLHFQAPPFVQGKLVRCMRGSLLDVVVDIRAGSPTFGEWTSEEITAENGVQLWVPPGFAHGFLTLEPDTMISYKVTADYSQQHDCGILWNDPAIGIEWPIAFHEAIISEKDRNQPRLCEIPSHF